MGENSLQAGRKSAVDRGITEESLIQAIQDASLVSIRDDNPHGAVPRKVLCERLQKGEKWMIKLLHRLIDNGIVKPTKISSTNIVGDRTVIAAYYVVKDSP